ncbi:related to nuclear pore complex protein Nup160 [Pseudozyma flocculosa]|uniref:Related to nuclear pore complex protein Nup160 n=1 Tax=Pseudozyma flocculosa TaxID=84751 RepID=A0A5C3F7V1_9BASI|nr:related to nuclear pore complex protein Nup160 [Pseudozyma flocculosa]
MPLPYTPYRLATAAIGPSTSRDSIHLSQSQDEPITVPTPSHPGYNSNSSTSASTSTSSPYSSIPEHHAAHARAYFPSPASGYDAGFVLARAVAGARELELRWCRISSSQGSVPAAATNSRALAKSDTFAPSLDALQSGPPPKTFLFPAPLLPNVGLFADRLSGCLYVVAVTTTGYLYRLNFPLPFLFHAASLGPAWSTEYRVSQLAAHDSSSGSAVGSRAATHAFIEDAGLVLLTCGDGSIVKLQQVRSGDHGFEGTWKESVLRPTSFLSGVSRFFSRSASPIDASSSPTHALSVTTYVDGNGYALAFAASRDRKLRVWNLVSESCVRTLDLPISADPGATAERQLMVAGDDADARGSKDGVPPFGLNAKPMLKLFSARDDEANSSVRYLLAYVPAPMPHGNMFALYSVDLEESRSSSGGLGEVSLVWEKRCDPETRGRGIELRDVAIAPISEDADEAWAMWTLWDAGNGPLLKYTRIGDESAAPSGPDESSTSIRLSGAAAPDDDWRTVSCERHFRPMHGDDFEEILEATRKSADPADVFLSRVLEPGRFSESTLRTAIKMYRDAVPSTSRQPSTLFGSLAEEVGTIVASNCELEVDPKTGGKLYDKFHSSIVREWTRFVGLAEQIEGSALWPIELSMPRLEAYGAAGTVAEPLVVTRAALCVPTLEDGPSIVERLQRLGEFAEAAAAAKGLNPSALEQVAAERRLLFSAADLHSADILPVLGSTSATVADVFEVVDAASQLVQQFSPVDIEAFTGSVQKLFSSPLGFSLEQAATELWCMDLCNIEGIATAVVEKLVNTLGASLESALSDVVALLTSGFEGDQDPTAPLRRHSDVTLSDLGASLCGDALLQAVAVRHTLATTFAILVIALYSCSDTAAQVSDIPLYVAHALSTLQSLNALLELARTPGVAEIQAQSFEAGDRDNLAARLGRLSVALPSVAKEKTRGALLVVSAADDRRAASSLGRKIGSVVVRALGSSDLLKGEVGDQASTPPMPVLSAGHARMGDALVRQGFPSAALAFLSHFPPTPAAHYVRARALVYLGRLDEAGEAFERVVPAVEAPALLQRNADGLVDLLPPSITSVSAKDRAALFYRHVSSFFEVADSPFHVAKFCQASIEAGDDFAGGASGDGGEQATSRDLWFKIFRAQLDMHDFSEAYATIMALPHPGLQKDCLRSLVGVMCEAGEIGTLLKFSFPGLQPEIERTLSFKARNSDPLSTPNYYFVLYSYHIFRGDLKSAGAVMYQHAQRIGEIHRGGDRAGLDPVGDFMDLAVKQAQSYLASINALSMIRPENAWFAHADTSDADEAAGGAAASSLLFGGQDDEQAASRRAKSSGPRALTSYVPSNLFAPTAREIRIVSLPDIRREYALILARLELVGRYPELGYSTSTLRPSDAVLLFVNADRFDLAFSTASALDVDMTPIFASLATKCVALARARTLRLRARGSDAVSSAEGDVLALQDSDEDLEEPEASFLALSEKAAGWTESASERAWRYLELHLDMFDTEQGCWRYRLVVLDKVVSLRLFGEMPACLKQWFERQRPDAVVRVLRRYGMIDEALRACIAMVKSETDTRLKHNKRPGSSWLPYSLFDEVLLQAEDPDSRPPAGSASATTTRGLAAELRQALDGRVEGLERRTREVKRQGEADLDRETKRREREGAGREWIPAA